MKNLLTILIVIIGIPVLAQEIQRPPVILAAGGSFEEGPFHISSWRLSQVHVVTLEVDESSGEDQQVQGGMLLGWNARIYPNPARNFIKVHFDLENSEEFTLKLTDAAGKVLLIRELPPVLPGQLLELDLSAYPAALYLLKIESPAHENSHTYQVYLVD